MQKDMMNEKKASGIGETVRQASASRTVAKIIRVVTVPPVMVATLIILLSIFRRDVVSTPLEGFLAIVFLAVVPMLAYPLSVAIPSIRVKGRKGQRDLAIYLSVAGYIGGVIYGFAAGVGRSMLVIFCTYLLSAVILLVCNLFHVKASGHACSSAGPIVLIAYMYGTKGGLFCAFTYSVIQIIMDLMLGKGSTLLAYFLPSSEDFMGFGVAIGILLLDYFVAYTVLGLGGVLRNKMHKVPAIILGVLIALGARYAVHIGSGFLFFASWAEWFFTQESIYAIGSVILDTFSGHVLSIVYSIIYNGTYMIPEIVITAICASGVAWIPYIKKYDVKS